MLGGGSKYVGASAGPVIKIRSQGKRVELTDLQTLTM